ncbi:MAG: ribosome recycling factor [Deltaproteobacteria bacterium]|nr:ribosome recycling factor [Deltaproteobacteria bacterium]NIS78597.1 ribosome recycling factor [Deltaproteobacteria bacterium]
MDWKDEMNRKMGKRIEVFQKELGKVRTGRASLAILDGIKVSYYGEQTPLNQVATLTVPESRLIVVQPWDAQMIPVIEKAITSSNLGLNPVNDGKIIRIQIPVLTEERRIDLVKTVKKMTEEARVAIRNIRREYMEVVKSMEKNKEISEDDLKRSQEEIQKDTDRNIRDIEEIFKGKEKEIREI